MAELKGAPRPKRVIPRPARWLLDDGNEETSESVLDPYAGRLFGDHVDFDPDDSDVDRVGDSHGLFDL